MRGWAGSEGLWLRVVYLVINRAYIVKAYAAVAFCECTNRVIGCIVSPRLEWAGTLGSAGSMQDLYAYGGISDSWFDVILLH